MRNSNTLVAAALALLVLGISSLARGDDLADEADLRFQLGAEAYQRGDFKDALQHFMASNRLVPNKNVLFNIAKTYEQLRSFPEAYRYYTLSLDGEKEPAARARIEKALTELGKNVAVLDIRTTPPGATLYVNRVDLGPRGESPRRLGLAAGSYEVIAKKAGYETATVAVKGAKVGSVVPVQLKLTPILGTVRIAGSPRGARARVADGSFDASCVIPCALAAPPGRRQILVEASGHRPQRLDVAVERDKAVNANVELEAITGALVLSTDEPGALIEVDDRPEGFTPAIVRVPVGKHRVRVTLSGFRPIERDVDLAADEQQRLELTLTQSEEVFAASRAAQPVSEAPGSVSIVPFRELRALAYPTIAEALRGTRGAYVYDDRSYVSVAVRGLGRLGSYGNRLLVLLDGHPTNDNWLGSSYVGYDARTDLADLERIELVRGPGSVLYGTNAFSGVVNLVTRRAEHTSGEVGVGTNLDGVARARARANLRLGKDAGAWTSVAMARGEGRDFFFPEYVADTPPEVAGHARGADGFTAGTVGGRAWWRFLTAQWFYHRHEKRLPTGEYDTLLADSRARQTDTRAFVEVKAEPSLGDVVALVTRVHANHYRFRGDYPRDPSDGGLSTDRYRGTWLGAEQRVAIAPSSDLKFTVGAEGQLHVQVDTESFDETATYLNETGASGRPYQVGAAYGSIDATPVRWLTTSGGVRLDAYSTFGRSVNPRAALILRAYDGGVTKLLGGKAFRAPSVYELFYNDGGVTQVASPDLAPESIYSVEVEHSHRFSPSVVGTVASYANYVENLIDFTGDGTAASPLQYQNSDVPLMTVGAEVEIRRDFRQGWMLAATYGLQHARYLADDGVAGITAFERAPGFRDVGNVPAQLASLKAAAPLLSRDVTASTRLSVEGPRFDRFESTSDPEQGRTKAFAIWDLVLSGFEPRSRLHWAIGVYNAFDWRHSLPVSAEFRQRAIPQSGRTFLASADVTF